MIDDEAAAQHADRVIQDVLGSSAEPYLRQLADAIAASGLRPLPVHDQLTAIRATARHAADLEATQPQTAASYRLAAVAAAEATGISTVWGAEPTIDPGPAINHLKDRGDTEQLETIKKHVDTMHREARTGVMLAGYTDPHQAELAQRERFVDVLTKLGLPAAVVDQIRNSPLANQSELTTVGGSAAAGNLHTQPGLGWRPPPSIVSGSKQPARPTI